MQHNNIPKATSPLAAWLFHLENIHNKAIDLSLERVSKVASRLNVLKPAPFVFTVAGTNGKGTTCKMLEIILIASGYNVGVYNSPHLISYTERVRIQNAELPEAAHTYSFAAIESARDDISLTYFEFSTLSALWLFKHTQLDVVILEVGLGGRLDATNIVDSNVAIITNVALDHTYWLGSERESIGREKAGIFRAGKPAVIGELDIPKTIVQIAQEKNIQLLRYGFDWYFSRNKNYWNFEDKLGKLSNLPIPRIPLENAATALAALRISKLKLTRQAIYKGISSATLPGRFQIISQAPRLILDVAHNPHAATYLVKQLQDIPRIGYILGVIGMLHDKDIAGMFACMENIVDWWYCASLEQPGGASAEQLMKYTNNKGISYASVVQAWIAAMTTAQMKDTVLVCGSFHTVASIIKLIQSKKQ